ncbi:MAG: hypothetical protein QF639_06790 [Rhodospirillales bacterium]|nr:hypothetical protein [Rhodospirillales bacterium]HJO96659.1 hypothetical protein [Rhodospirillales bacterium]
MSRTYMHARVDGTEWPDQDIELPKGQHTAGQAIGILLLDDFYWPFMPGDMANASTFDFPVLHKVVEGTELMQVKNADPAVADMLIESGRELERQGVRAIVGGCGFFGHHQSRVAAALDVPVVLSSLEQIPLVRRMLRPGRKIGVFSDAHYLTPALFRASGVEDISDIVVSNSTALPAVQKQQKTGSFNPHRYERQLVDLAKELVGENPDIGALVAEYTEFPTFAWAVQNAVGLPVFDCSTLTRWVHDAVVRRPIGGFI